MYLYISIACIFHLHASSSSLHLPLACIFHLQVFSFCMQWKLHSYFCFDKWFSFFVPFICVISSNLGTYQWFAPRMWELWWGWATNGNLTSIHSTGVGILTEKIFLLPLKFCIKILWELDFIGIVRSVVPRGGNLTELPGSPRVCELKTPNFQISLGISPPPPSWGKQYIDRCIKPRNKA